MEFYLKINPLQHIKQFAIMILKNNSYLLKKVEYLGKLLRVRREVRRILALLQTDDIENILIVYDTLASPPTYGDFFYTVMFARYFTSRDISVNFVIVEGSSRWDWSVLDDSEKNNVMHDYVEIASVLLDPYLATIEVLTSQQLLAKMSDNLANGVYVPFQKNVANRSSVYSFVMDTLNGLCSKSSQSHVDRFLLSFEELRQKVSFRKPHEPYITWGCRYSTKWGFDRNTSEERFVQIHSRLKLLYPDHSIMVVSDSVGCQHFRELAVKYGLNCLFSKDYSSTLMGDGGLILGSTYFFMHVCGGIVVFPWFSQVSYEMLISLVHEKPWTTDKLYSWSSKKQIWRSPFATEYYLPSLGPMLNDESHL